MIRRIGDLKPGDSFITLLTDRVGTVLDEATDTGVPVELDRLLPRIWYQEHKTIHPDILVLTG